MEKSKATYITTPLDTKAQDIWNKGIDEAIEKNKDPKAAIQQSPMTSKEPLRLTKTC